MTLKNNIYIDEIVRISELVIDKFKNEDIEFDIMPYLFKGSLSTKSAFFDDNNITLSNYTSSEDLKTISHLAMFYKERVAHDPFNIVRYLRCIGHIGYDENPMEIGIYEKNHCGDIGYAIPLDSYKKLNYSVVSIIGIFNQVSALKEAYFDGLDTGIDQIGMK